MPIYEYGCQEHGTFEVLKTSHLHRSEQERCPLCDSVCDSIASLVFMQPDSYWMGVVTPNQHYVTSRAEYNATMANLEPVTRDTAEWTAKRKAARKRELESKQLHKLEDFVTKELASVTIDPDYNHLPGNRLKKSSKF
jgi:putative FmdB family regulatory protein